MSMKLSRRRFLRLAGIAAAATAVPRPAFAQAYPNRPVRFVVPFPAGGTTDLIARIISQWLADRLGQPVVVENRPGGGTNIAALSVVNAPPDGYTLLMTVTTHVINPSLYKVLPFDIRRDITPVSGLAELPLVMSVTPGLPVKSVAEFVAHAKANPGKVNVASFGVRTISHLAIEMFKSATGVDVVHVPYSGGVAFMPDMIAGRIEAGVDALPNSLPHIRSGAIRAIAALSTARIPLLPDLPTMAEAVPGLEISGWTGIGAPRATPPEIVERLNREINAGLADAGVLSRFADVGAVAVRFTPAEARVRIAADIEKWAKVIAAAGIKPE
jgi:tripartite-type tricarboxylate transporter receptor subunit TctC